MYNIKKDGNLLNIPIFMADWMTDFLNFATPTIKSGKMCVKPLKILGKMCKFVLKILGKMCKN
jgi:hypothetical protein